MKTYTNLFIELQDADTYAKPGVKTAISILVDGAQVQQLTNDRRFLSVQLNPQKKDDDAHYVQFTKIILQTVPGIKKITIVHPALIPIMLPVAEHGED